MSGYYGQTFAGQQGIIDNLKSSVDSLVKAGPGQYGFSAGEDAALRTRASAGTADAYKMASQATGEKLAAQGGGNQFLPSGTKNAIARGDALDAAQEESRQQLGVTEAGFAQGRQNYQTGLQEESGLAQLENPEAYGGQASSTQQGAFDQFRKMANDPGSLGIVGGILGSVAGQVGSGLAQGGCPSEGTLIKMADEPDALVENLNVGDLIMGIDGEPDEITQIRPTPVQPVWKVETHGHFVVVSGGHCFVRLMGGYAYAYECAETPLQVVSGYVKATATPYGSSVCYQIETKRTHSYAAAGFWSLT
jgi:hypothetical protein